MNIAKIISDTLAGIDNWSPTTCPMPELTEHVGDLEQIEGLLVQLANRASYLRGVIAARALSSV